MRFHNEQSLSMLKTFFYFCFYFWNVKEFCSSSTRLLNWHSKKVSRRCQLPNLPVWCNQNAARHWFVTAEQEKMANVQDGATLMDKIRSQFWIMSKKLYSIIVLRQKLLIIWFILINVRLIKLSRIKCSAKWDF